jgi:hypothetical protein
MPRASPFRRIARLSGENWRLLAEALPTLVVASVAVKFLPFKQVAASAARFRQGPPGPVDEAFLRKVRWAIDEWADRVPWRAVCFQRGLALHRMLRRRGIPSILHYGVAQSPEDGVSAHVWVSVGEQTVIGGEEAPRFKCLATFPAPEVAAAANRLDGKPFS